jgi:hypothetical protein
MGTKVIAVRVGLEGHYTDFTTHEQLISASSDYFKAALGRDWRDAKERLVKLPLCDPKAFQIYVQWLYSGPLYAASSKDPTPTIDWAIVTQGYLLGDYLQDSNYKDTVLDVMRERIKSCNISECTLLVLGYVKEIFQETSSQAPIRRLLVDTAVWCLENAFWRGHTCDLPGEFTQDAVIVFSDRFRPVNRATNPFVVGSRVQDTCQYHCHGEKPCYKLGKGVQCESPNWFDHVSSDRCYRIVGIVTLPHSHNIDIRHPSKGSREFRVLGEGKVLWSSEPMIKH